MEPGLVLRVRTNRRPGKVHTCQSDLRLPTASSFDRPSDQPPWCARLPEFFLLRVWLPRSWLIRWPRFMLGLMPGGGVGWGVRRSASTRMCWAM